MTAMPAEAAGRLIWALGDSLTAGYGLPPADGFTSQLQVALQKAGVPATVRNGGITGDTSAQGKARLLWGLRGLGVKPDLVILELGANDMLRGMPPSQTAANLDAIMDELKRRQIRVLVAGMRAAPNMGPAYARGFDPIYPRLAKRYGARFYPFFLDGVAADMTLLQADGMHPNAKGVSIIVGRILPSVRAALKP
ncbi:arylesterase [Sphingomonas sp. PR090111-T3T-6A]|uniref:arylesterase n=1 Tax=Sphingomonas sp. PR090111-T3T-6A TaxID=685778 RepID=UPI00056AC996|nr:arylesterase [Sphingomonas sp. PR090111-T3T-6A]